MESFQIYCLRSLAASSIHEWKGCREDRSILFSSTSIIRILLRKCSIVLWLSSNSFLCWRILSPSACASRFCSNNAFRKSEISFVFRPVVSCCTRDDVHDRIQDTRIDLSSWRISDGSRPRLSLVNNASGNSSIKRRTTLSWLMCLNARCNGSIAWSSAQRTPSGYTSTIFLMIVVGAPKIIAACNGMWDHFIFWLFLSYRVIQVAAWSAYGTRQLSFPMRHESYFPSVRKSWVWHHSFISSSW